MEEESVGLAAVALNLEGYKVLGIGDEKIGTVEGTWEDETGKAAFISVKTGLMGRAHFVPLSKAEIIESHKTVRVPFHKDRVKDSPDFKSESHLDAISETKLYDYYYGRRGQYAGGETGGGKAPVEGEVADRTMGEDRRTIGDRRTGEDRREKKEEPGEKKEGMKEGLKEKFEDLKAGKKETEAASVTEGVGLRKVLYTKKVEEFEPGKEPVEGTGVLKEFKKEEEISPLRDKVAEIKKAAAEKKESVGEALEDAKERLERDRGTLG
jgi:hypothetical protein